MTKSYYAAPRVDARVADDAIPRLRGPWGAAGEIEQLYIASDL